MPIPYSRLRDTIAAFHHRPANVFYYNGVDLLLQAVNNAKNFAQRALDFELARKFGQINGVSLRDGALIDEILEFGTGNTFIPKSLKRAFLDDGGGGQFPIGFMSRDAYVARYKREVTNFLEVQPPSTTVTPSSMMPTVVQVGNRIFLTPLAKNAPPTATLYFDAIQWLEDFTFTPIGRVVTSVGAFLLIDTQGNFIANGVRIGDLVVNGVSGATAQVTAVNASTTLTLNADIMQAGQSYQIYVTNQTQTNFLMDFCFDFLQFYSIHELNFYLKEDERVKISDDKLDKAWNNVIRWNETIIGNTVDDNDLN